MCVLQDVVSVESKRAPSELPAVTPGCQDDQRLNDVITVEGSRVVFTRQIDLGNLFTKLLCYRLC